MAPPINRRTSYSRRAQYVTFFAYVAGVLGALVGVLFLLFSRADQTSFGWLRTSASDVTSPAARATATVHAGAGGIYDIVAGYLTSGPENARLKREVALARSRLIQAEATDAENRRLKDLLHLAGDTPKPVATAWLIASTDTSTRRYATISAGSLQGVKPGMPVRTQLGLVGRVLEAGHVSARILLVTDTESVVPVRRASDGLPAFATGRGDGTLQIRLLTLAINPLKPGDAFVASGSGGLYWPGTPLAVVGTLTHDGAIARVLSDPYASETVAIQPVWNPVEDASLPAPSGPPHPERRPPRAAPKSPAGKTGTKPAHHKHWL